MNRAPYELAEKIFEFVKLSFPNQTREWIQQNTGRKLRKRRRASALSDFKLVGTEKYKGRVFLIMP